MKHHQLDIPPLMSGRKPSGTSVIVKWKSLPNQLLRRALGTEPEGGLEIKIGYSLDGVLQSKVRPAWQWLLTGWPSKVLS